MEKNNISLSFVDWFVLRPTNALTYASSIIHFIMLLCYLIVFMAFGTQIIFWDWRNEVKWLRWGTLELDTIHTLLSNENQNK